MLRISENTKARFDVVPALLVVESTPHELGDECAPPTRANPAIEFSDELVVESYVQTHGL